MSSKSTPAKRKREGDVDDETLPVKKKPTEEETSVSVQDLLLLLDFTTLSTLPEIDARFKQIASLLLRDFHLVVSASPASESAFEILELEFYLIKPQCHEDPFTHGSEEQKHSGKWYFHRAPRRSGVGPDSTTAAGGYKGGSRKGLDLTFGAPTSISSHHFQQESTSDEPQVALPPIRGGVLLRSLRRVVDRKVISGPSLLVDEVLRQCKANSIAELVDTKWKGNITAFKNLESPASADLPIPGVLLYMRPRRTEGSAPKPPPTGIMSFLKAGSSATSTTPSKPRIYRSPRIGLDLSHSGIPTNLGQAVEHPRVLFVSKPYRYFTHPELLTANGRGQTLLGIYRDDMAHFDSDKDREDIQIASLDEIVRKTGLKDATARKYVDDFKEGYDKCPLKSFIGPAGKGASSSPSPFLKMMGALMKVKEPINKQESASTSESPAD